MLQIQDLELTQLAHEPKPTTSMQYLAEHPVLDLPFRSFFLLAVFGSMAALAIWAAYLNGHFSFTGDAITPLTWHIHEMIFGFAATVALGFILTAVQTWTGTASIKGRAVLAFIALWLLIRVLLFINTTSTFFIAVTLQTLWWLAAIVIFSQRVISQQNRRNYLFIPLLMVLMQLNIALLLVDFYGFADFTRHLARTCVLMFCLLMGILGGRVIPFFTASGAKIPALTTPYWLTTVLTVMSLLAVLVFFCSKFFNFSYIPAIFMMAAGILHIVRQSYWHSWATRKISLLWSLHCAYFSLGLGLILLGLSYLPKALAPSWFLSINFASALHLLTIGAMGLMIFAMMARVSLGHTGRALTPSKVVSWIFYLIIISAISRVFLPMLPEMATQVMLSWNISVFTWFIAGLLFLRGYWSILTSKKVDKYLHR